MLNPHSLERADKNGGSNQLDSGLRSTEMVGASMRNAHVANEM